jgi:hypothetical protein
MKAGGRSPFFSLALIVLVAGCRSKEPLEAELRNKELLYRESLEEQRKAECRIESLQREVDALRHGGRLSPEQAAIAGGVRRITLGRATGGYDRDGQPGDELLQVVLEPRDCDDHVIKAPGVLQIFVLDITPQGLKVPIGSWELSPEDLSKNWKQGLLSSGYILNLPWKQYPHCDSIRVVARFIVGDGRVYETDKDTRAHVMPGAAGRPPEVITDPPTPPPPSDSLPPPRVFPSSNPSEGPLILPSSKSEYRGPRPNTPWVPASPPGSVRIGRPEPVQP